jgi:16S rRNA G1207 methylase RsmC
MTFRTTWGLFSPKAIDEGSQLLLDVTDVTDGERILDLGCGYGTLGLTLARKSPRGQAVLLDKDFVAVDYARANARLNRLENVDVRLSNGFSAVDKGEQFDLVVSNLPAKVGNEMLTLFIHDAFDHMTPGGRLVVVTIAGLSRYIKREFKDVFGNYKKLKQGKTYTVAMARKS